MLPFELLYPEWPDSESESRTVIAVTGMGSVYWFRGSIGED